MKKENKQLYKYILADMLTIKTIKGVLLLDACKGFGLVKNRKHLKGKSIKRRNRKHEIVYNDQVRRIHYWEEVLQIKKNIDLLDIDYDSDDIELKERAFQIAQEMVSYKVSLRLNNNSYITARRDDKRVQAGVFIAEEIKKVEETKKMKKGDNNYE